MAGEGETRPLAPRTPATTEPPCEGLAPAVPPPRIIIPSRQEGSKGSSRGQSSAPPHRGHLGRGPTASPRARPRLHVGPRSPWHTHPWGSERRCGAGGGSGSGALARDRLCWCPRALSLLCPLPPHDSQVPALPCLALCPHLSAALPSPWHVPPLLSAFLTPSSSSVPAPQHARQVPAVFSQVLSGLFPLSSPRQHLGLAEHADSH